MRRVRPGELLRLYVVNAGPNRISSSTWWAESSSAFFRTGRRQARWLASKLRMSRDYPFVTHAFADATKGAVGVLRALAPGEARPDQMGAMAH